MNTIIEASHVGFAYGQDQVLRDICFTVNAGDFAGVIGSNGAGKSTLLRLLLGELVPQSGTIRLFGEDVNAFGGWPRIGYVPQNGAAMAAGFPANAAEVVGANLYKKIGPLRLPGSGERRQVLEALARVGMQDYARQMIGKLSGGQLQRVLLARALIGEPELLLLDEPTTGVDADSAAELYERLKALSESGVTVVMVTHDTLRAADYIKRALCLERGTLVELDGEQLAHELAHRHRHP